MANTFHPPLSLTMSQQQQQQEQQHDLNINHSCLNSQHHGIPPPAKAPPDTQYLDNEEINSTTSCSDAEVEQKAGHRHNDLRQPATGTCNDAQQRKLGEGEGKGVDRDVIEGDSTDGKRHVLVTNDDSSSPDPLSWARLAPRHNEKWLQRFEELRKFVREEGHCLVPRQFEGGLGSWVHNQRSQYVLFKEGKHNRMTSERIQMLEGVGFVWDASISSRHSPLVKSVTQPQRRKPQDGKWMKKFEELKAYKRKFGNTLVPQSYKRDIPLGKW